MTEETPPPPSHVGVIFLIGTLIFCLLCIGILLLSTWVLRVNFKLSACKSNPSVWCYNDWQCATRTDGGQGSCFTNEYAGGPGDNLMDCIIDQLTCMIDGSCGCAMSDANNCTLACPYNSNTLMVHLGSGTCPSLCGGNSGVACRSPPLN